MILEPPPHSKMHVLGPHSSVPNVSSALTINGSQELIFCGQTLLANSIYVNLSSELFHASSPSLIFQLNQCVAAIANALVALHFMIALFLI